MSKEKIHIDDLFKRGIKGVEQPLNGSEWDRLYSALQTQKRRKFLWWWWIAPIALLFGGLTWWAQTRPIAQNATIQPESGVLLITDHDDTSNEGPETMNTVETNVEDVLISKTQNTDAPQQVNHRDEETRIGQNGNGPSSGKKQKVKSSVKPSVKAPILNDTIEKRKTFDLVQLLPKELRHIGQGWQLLIPSLIQTVFHPKHETETTMPTTPASYIAFQTGANRVQQKLSSSNPDYTRLRGANEAPAVRLFTGFEYGMNWKSIDLKGGLNYLEKGQTLRSPYTIQLYDSVPYIDLNGKVTWIPFNYRDSVIQTPKQAPVYRYVQIPIQFGKTFSLADRYSVEMGLNGQMQFLLQAQGTAMNTTLKPLDIHANGFNRINFAFGAYTGVTRELNQNLDVHVRLNWSQDVSNMFNSSNWKQKFSYTGMAVSLRYKLY